MFQIRAKPRILKMVTPRFLDRNNTKSANRIMNTQGGKAIIPVSKIFNPLSATRENALVTKEKCKTRKSITASMASPIGILGIKGMVLDILFVTSPFGYGAYKLTADNNPQKPILFIGYNQRIRNFMQDGEKLGRWGVR
jgi:hypothetical protein